MSPATALFSVGTLIHHRLFQYRGVIFDVDPVVSGNRRMVRPKWRVPARRATNPGTM